MVDVAKNYGPGMPDIRRARSGNTGPSGDLYDIEDLIPRAEDTEQADLIARQERDFDIRNTLFSIPDYAEGERYDMLDASNMLMRLLYDGNTELAERFVQHVEMLRAGSKREFDDGIGKSQYDSLVSAWRGGNLDIFDMDDSQKRVGIAKIIGVDPGNVKDRLDSTKRQIIGALDNADLI